MKNKMPLALIELVIMILVFALAAALCLTAFVWASQQSEAIALRDDAALAVQNTAEALKHQTGDAGMLADDDYDGRFTIERVILQPDIKGLGGAQVRAVSPEGEVIFQVEVYWQEPLGESNPRDAAEGGAGSE